MGKHLKKIYKIIISIALFIIVASFVGIMIHSYLIIASMANVRVEKNDSFIDIYKGEIERIETVSSDGLTISAWKFDVPEPKGIVIITHGMHGMDASSILDYGKFFKEEGYEALVLDMRAHGYSSGDVIGLGFTEVHDFDAIIDWVKAQDDYNDEEIILYGLSMGGSAAINAAAKNEEVDAVIAVSAFEAFESQIVDYMKDGGVPSFIRSLYKPAFKIVLTGKYRMNPSKNSPIQTISQIDSRPMLIIHGDEDDQTSVRHAYNLKEKAGENAELWIIEGKGHFVVEDILADESDWYRQNIIKFLKEHRLD